MRGEFRPEETGGGSARKRAELLDRGQRLLRAVEQLIGYRRAAVHDLPGLESTLVVVVGQLASEMSTGRPASGIGSTLAEAHAVRSGRAHV